MSQHTPEPWYVVDYYIYRRPKHDLYEFGGGVAGDKPIASFSKGWFDFNSEGYPVKENIERAVQCVNACAGMEDPAAYITDLRAQLDEAVKALEEIASYWNRVVDSRIMQNACLHNIVIAESTLTKLKGGADDAK